MPHMHVGKGKGVGRTGGQEVCRRVRTDTDNPTLAF